MTRAYNMAAVSVTVALYRALIKKGVLTREEATGILLDEAVARAIKAEAQQGPEVSATRADRKVRRVFAIASLERVASSSCVPSFRPLLHEAATGAALARTLIWSPDLQPHPLPLHICALTAEDILIEHSSNATGADCCGYRDSTAFSAVAPRERRAWLTVRAPE